MVTKKTIQEHLNLFKEEAILSIKKLQFKKGLTWIELYAQIAYKYNLVYGDEEVETLIEKTSLLLLNDKKIRNTKNKIVFYDSFAMDNRGLTQQYLRAIFSWNCELLFISPSTIGYDILAELKAYSKAQILIYDKNNIEDFNKVQMAIADFEPEKVFLHFSPWDISGFCIWNTIKNVDRFLINLTDHAFWLGRNCADYILEFRRYGAYLSVHERTINIEKLLLQPYYPIINTKEFQGFPFKKNGIVAFAGSNLYKISGRNNAFLLLIKEVLLQNKDLVFVLAGPGNKVPIENFIKENLFQDRFFVIGDRKDISAVVENIDIYVNTFPMIGGLMSQYAAVCQKPIIGYTSSDLFGYNDVEDLLQVPQQELLVKKTEKDFIAYFNQLCESKECRDVNVQLTKDCVLTSDLFNSKLYENIYNFKDSIQNTYITNVQFDSQVIAELYIDMENNYQRNHFLIVWNIIRFRMLLYFPQKGLGIVLSKMLKKANLF